MAAARRSPCAAWERRCRYVQLSSLDAMAGPSALAAGQVVNVVARVSASGQPMAASGDLYGELRYRVGKDGPRHLLIDQSTP
ncbi:MAG: hypothetical protein U1F67_01290 [Rubrivivax sp.]